MSAASRWAPYWLLWISLSYFYNYDELKFNDATDWHLVTWHSAYHIGPTYHACAILVKDTAWFDAICLTTCDLYSDPPPSSSWPHLRRDVVWRKGNIHENCLCATVLWTITMVHKDTSSSYRSVDCIGLWSCLV